METKLMSSRDIVAILKKEGVNYKSLATFDTAIWGAKRDMEIKPLIRIKNTLYYTEKDAQMIIKWVKGNYTGRRKGVRTKKEKKENIKEVKKQESKEKETQGIESIEKELELIKAEIVELRKLIVLDDPNQEIMDELNELKEIINNKKFSIFGR